MERAHDDNVYCLFFYLPGNGEILYSKILAFFCVRNSKKLEHFFQFEFLSTKKKSTFTKVKLHLITAADAHTKAYLIVIRSFYHTSYNLT